MSHARCPTVQVGNNALPFPTLTLASHSHNNSNAEHNASHSTWRSRYTLVPAVFPGNEEDDFQSNFNRLQSDANSFSDCPSQLTGLGIRFGAPSALLRDPKGASSSRRRVPAHLARTDAHFDTYEKAESRPDPYVPPKSLESSWSFSSGDSDSMPIFDSSGSFSFSEVFKQAAASPSSDFSSLFSLPCLSDSESSSRSLESLYSTGNQVDPVKRELSMWSSPPEAGGPGTSSRPYDFGFGALQQYSSDTPDMNALADINMDDYQLQYPTCVDPFDVTRTSVMYIKAEDGSNLLVRSPPRLRLSTPPPRTKISEHTRKLQLNEQIAKDIVVDEKHVEAVPDVGAHFDTIDMQVQGATSEDEEPSETFDDALFIPSPSPSNSPRLPQAYNVALDTSDGVVMLDGILNTLGTPMLDAHRGISVEELHRKALRYQMRNPGKEFDKSWLIAFAGKLSPEGALLDEFRCYVNGCKQRNKRKDHIVTHMGSHLGQRPFKCEHW